MKGDPLRGVHAFYAASAREWWRRCGPAPASGAATRSSACSTSQRVRRRAVHEWTAQVFRDEDGAVLAGQYRNMIRTEREKARERKKYDAITIEPYTDEQIAAIDAQYAAEGRRAAPSRVGGRTSTRATRSARS